MFIMRQTILRKSKVVGGIEVTLFVVEYELFVCQRTRKEIKRAYVLEYRGTTTKLHIYYKSEIPFLTD